MGLNIALAVGDSVRIIDGGYTYSTYDTAAATLGLTSWKESVNAKTGTIGKIVNVMVHPGYDVGLDAEDDFAQAILTMFQSIVPDSKGELLYGVEVESVQYVIGFQGVKKVIVAA